MINYYDYRFVYPNREETYVFQKTQITGSVYHKSEIPLRSHTKSSIHSSMSSPTIKTWTSENPPSIDLWVSIDILGVKSGESQELKVIFKCCDLGWGDVLKYKRSGDLRARALRWH